MLAWFVCPTASMVISSKAASLEKTIVGTFYKIARWPSARKYSYHWSILDSSHLKWPFYSQYDVHVCIIPETGRKHEYDSVNFDTYVTHHFHSQLDIIK